MGDLVVPKRPDSMFEEDWGGGNTADGVNMSNGSRLDRMERVCERISVRLMRIEAAVEEMRASLARPAVKKSVTV